MSTKASTVETHLVDHITFWMPAFVAHVPVDLDELLENGTITPCAFRGKTSGVVEMTIDIVFMFVI